MLFNTDMIFVVAVLGCFSLSVATLIGVYDFAKYLLKQTYKGLLFWR